MEWYLNVMLHFDSGDTRKNDIALCLIGICRNQRGEGAGRHHFSCPVLEGIVGERPDARPVDVDGEDLVVGLVMVRV
jgi:hypothetical protein